MALGTKHVLHLTKPSSRSSPLNIVIEPAVLFSILDHSTRKSENNQRVIGTLLGTRSEDGREIEIKSCFAVPHNESSEQVEVEMEYHRAMYHLHLKANPREVVVGWYATSPDLDAFSALIQNLYASPAEPGTAPLGTYPHPCVHLTVNTDVSSPLAIKTYVSSPVGITERLADSCAFVPTPFTIRDDEAVRSGLKAVAAPKNDPSRLASLFTDLQQLRRSTLELLSMIERVSDYVQNVIDGSSPANVAVGRYLMKCFSLIPCVEGQDFEKIFSSHLQDVLVVVYLANTLRTQVDIASRLNLLP
ncbi:Eukaryotic translation initiation factor 3 subunit F [Schizosaccharomyces pombe]|uniref:Eukaryotic translation initiation factor 3 subunit F n=1 Tax=Schizosaccharomyces pombe (strain 972 / ATCC 24843) TaxID=284812 RepID=EIF3F_SCHPO|nr:translation initiation factor eIF3f [Schizosaccharomyces pombe]O43060.1 RecName: Full=Eukaryotic translation initiation factor 3 subunit F; Short=eIF3f [Schizosaccharomyces pombe 972h-]CAA16829.1 translation initiation factor eIF3f [Schizosaccharomyces pombe]|eukprot:NP_596298.1 translation initiation factor eIF3f [Schizosaccharomyces pombe]